MTPVTVPSSALSITIGRPSGFSAPYSVSAAAFVSTTLPGARRAPCASPATNGKSKMSRNDASATKPRNRAERSPACAAMSSVAFFFGSNTRATAGNCGKSVLRYRANHSLLRGSTPVSKLPSRARSRVVTTSVRLAFANCPSAEPR
jgi:hypothetical protein